MATVVTVMNMKGGVGKTTVAVHLAGILSQFPDLNKQRLNVLAIDYDPQFNFSQAYIEPKKYFSLEKAHKTTLSILLDDMSKLNPYQLQVSGNHNPPKVASLITNIYGNQQNSGRLDIIPATLDLMYIALGQANTKMEPIEERFSKFIAEARTLYDVVLIDCHPAGSLFTKTSLRNSDHVLIPVMPHKYAARGIALMMEFMRAKKIGEVGPQPIILFNATARSEVSPEEAFIRANPRFSTACLPTTLKWYKAFGEPQGGDHFVWQSKKPYSTSAFINLLAVVRDFRAKVGI